MSTMANDFHTLTNALLIVVGLAILLALVTIQSEVSEMNETLDEIEKKARQEQIVELEKNIEQE